MSKSSLRDHRTKRPEIVFAALASLWKKKLTKVVSVVLLVFALGSLAVLTQPVRALTGTIYPDGDVTRWAAQTGCTATTHYACVNETTHSTANYVNTGTAGTTGETLEFTMESTASADVSITQFSVDIYANSVACNGNTPNCDSITVNIRKAGVTIGTATHTLSTSNTLYTTVSTGGPWTSDSDLQVQVIRNRVGGGNAANADDDVLLTGLRSTVTYTPTYTVNQAAYRWYQNNINDPSHDSYTKLTNPSNLPVGNGSGTAWSPDGVYMSVTHFTTPFITIYKRSGDTFTKLANPSTLPPGNATESSWSSNGVYLTVTHSTTPFITIYKRSGDTFTKLANPSSLPPGNGGVSWSPDSVYMTVTHSSTPYVTIYKRSNDVFSKLSNPGALPAASSFHSSWSPDGSLLTVSHLSSPYITIYKRSGDTFTKLADPNDLPTSTGRGSSWSPDGVYMSVTHEISPFITIYKRSGDTFTKLADPSTLPAGNASSSSWSPDGAYLTVTHSTTPFITIYKRSGDTFTKLANPSTLPTGGATQPSWSPDGVYLSVSHATTPFITIYKRSLSADVGSPLAATSTPGVAPEPGQPFRLRLNLGIAASSLTANNFKLRYYWSSNGVCSSSASYVDVTNSSVIKFYDNVGMPPGIGLTTNANDPTRSGITAVRQSYNKSNPFSVRTQIPSGQDGIWDFSLTFDTSAQLTGAYCLKATHSDNTDLNTYTSIAQISAPVPTYSQSSYRWYENADSTTPGTPLASQDTPVIVAPGTNVRLRQLVRVDNNTAEAGSQYMLQYAPKVSTCSAATYQNAFVGGDTGFLIGGSYVQGSGGNFTWNNPDQFANPGGFFTPPTYSDPMGNDGATNTITLTNYDFSSIPVGATITGAEVQFGAISFSNLQSAIFTVNLEDGGQIGVVKSRTFSETGVQHTLGNSADLWGTSLTRAQVTNPNFGIKFKYNHTALAPNAGLESYRVWLKIYYSAGGSSAPIGYNDNASVTSNATIIATGNDPADGARTIVPQAYLELDPFSYTTIPSVGQSAMWDFSLKTSALASGTYCLRIANSSGTALNSYLQYPEITVGTTGPSIDQQMRGGKAVVNGTKSPFTW